MIKNDKDFPELVLKQYVKNRFEEPDDEKLGAFLQLKYQSKQDAKAKPGEVKRIQNTFVDD